MPVALSRNRLVHPQQAHPVCHVQGAEARAGQLHHARSKTIWALRSHVCKLHRHYRAQVDCSSVRIREKQASVHKADAPCEKKHERGALHFVGLTTLRRHPAASVCKKTTFVGNGLEQERRARKARVSMARCTRTSPTLSNPQRKRELPGLCGYADLERKTTHNTHDARATQ